MRPAQAVQYSYRIQAFGLLRSAVKPRKQSGPGFEAKECACARPTLTEVPRIAGLIIAALLLTLAPAGSAAENVRAESHVPTAVYCCHGYANDTVSPYQAAPFVNWATTDLPDGAIADRLAGIQHTVQYIDASRIYTTDSAYRFVDGGQFAGAVATNCAGQPIRTSKPVGYLVDPWKPETVRLLDWSVDHRFNPAYSNYFFDDVDAYRWDLANGPPCTGNPPQPWTEPATAKEYADLLSAVRIDATGRAETPKIVFNGLSMYADKPDMHLVPLYALAAPNVVGGMCEGCYADNTPDALKNGIVWQDDLDIEIKTIHLHKIFWDYVRYIANDPNARIYTFASFMLAWDPNYSIYQTAYKPANLGQLHITPETGLVAHDPLKRNVSGVYDLRDPGGTYVREYRNCYYRALPIGPCAFVVNSDNLPHGAPKLSITYHHTVALSGGMVLEGGTLSTSGGELPGVIPPLRGFILTR